MKPFYVYEWMKDGVVVYVGKGTKRRAYRNPDVEVRVVKENLSETEAFDLERQRILMHGRQDKGEGTLWNLTDGGGIAFSSLYWEEGSYLKIKHQNSIETRDSKEGWLEGAKTRMKNVTEKRPKDWQDSVYQLLSPSGESMILKTQEIKVFATTIGTTADAIRNLARKKGVPFKAKHDARNKKPNPLYGWSAICLFNKVTGEKMEPINHEKLY